DRSRWLAAESRAIESGGERSPFCFRVEKFVTRSGFRLDNLAGRVYENLNLDESRCTTGLRLPRVPRFFGRHDLKVQKRVFIAHDKAVPRFGLVGSRFAGHFPG